MLLLTFLMLLEKYEIPDFLSSLHPPPKKKKKKKKKMGLFVNTSNGYIH